MTWLTPERSYNLTEALKPLWVETSTQRGCSLTLQIKVEPRYSHNSNFMKNRLELRIGAVNFGESNFTLSSFSNLLELLSEHGAIKEALVPGERMSMQAWDRQKEVPDYRYMFWCTVHHVHRVSDATAFTCWQLLPGIMFCRNNILQRRTWSQGPDWSWRFPV